MENKNTRLNKTNVICLMGPTASGKTDLAFECQRRFPCEIISVDSVMIYRKLNIGSAKPSSELLARVPHHLVDICDPIDIYSAADFCRDAIVAMDQIIAKGKIPLLVGGTMLYFRALQQPLADLPQRDVNIREKITEEIQTQGFLKAHQRLQRIDPISAARIHPHDRQRLQRALEVYDITQMPLSALLAKAQLASPYIFHNLALMPARAELHERIAARTSAMLRAGLIEEVRHLKLRWDLSLDLPSMRSVGYRQVWEYLSGSILQRDLAEKITIATRQLAKRQLTWLRSWPDLHILDEHFLPQVTSLFEAIKESE